MTDNEGKSCWALQLNGGGNAIPHPLVPFNYLLPN